MSQGKRSIWKLIIGMLVILALISTYFGCLFSSMFSPEGMVGNPFHMIGWIHRNGFPKFSFAVCMIVLSICAIAIVFNFIIGHGKLDELGRLFWQPRLRKTYGDAHFEKPNEYKDVAVIKTPEEALGPIIGQLDDSGQHLISALTKKMLGNNHQAVFGTSGSGKSYTYTNNAVMQAVRRHESLIISDPDGGLERTFRGYLINKGYVVRTLNLRDFLYSNGWDCLKSIANENPDITVTKIQIFTQVCIENTFAGDGKKDIYFTGPLELFRALVMRVWFGKDFEPEKKNIKTIVELLNQPEIEEALNNLFDESQLITKDEKRCLGPWRTFLSSSKNLKGNLITNLGAMLGVIQDSDALSTLLSTDEIDLELPGDQPCAYFCQFSDTHSTYKFIVSLFFSMLTQCLVDKADKCPGGRLPVTVNFLLDEFPSIGVLPDWKSKMAVVRKRNMNIIMVFQNITQLQSNYQDDWVTIISNCDVFVSLAVNDEFTATMLQRKIGTTTVQVQTDSHSPDENILAGLIEPRRSSGEGKRDLLSIDEIMKMKSTDSLILFTGHNPIHAKKYPYVNHPDAYLTDAPDPLGPMPLLSDKEARADRLKKEEEMIQTYYNKHPNALIHLDEVAPKTPDTLAVTLKTRARMVRIRLKRRIHKLRTGEDLDAEGHGTSFRDYEEIVYETPGANEAEESGEATSAHSESDAPSIPEVDPATGEVIDEDSHDKPGVRDGSSKKEEEQESDEPFSLSSEDDMSQSDFDAVFSDFSAFIETAGNHPPTAKQHPTPKPAKEAPPAPAPVQPSVQAQHHTVQPDNSGEVPSAYGNRPPSKMQRPPAKKT